jgi:hypothetical protein
MARRRHTPPLRRGGGRVVHTTGLLIRFEPLRGCKRVLVGIQELGRSPGRPQPDLPTVSEEPS